MTGWEDDTFERLEVDVGFIQYDENKGVVHEWKILEEEPSKRKLYIKKYNSLAAQKARRKSRLSGQKNKLKLTPEKYTEKLIKFSQLLSGAQRDYSLFEAAYQTEYKHNNDGERVTGSFDEEKLKREYLPEKNEYEQKLGRFIATELSQGNHKLIANLIDKTSTEEKRQLTMQHQFIVFYRNYLRENKQIPDSSSDMETWCESKGWNIGENAHKYANKLGLSFYQQL